MHLEGKTYMINSGTDFGQKFFLIHSEKYSECSPSKITNLIRYGNWQWCTYIIYLYLKRYNCWFCIELFRNALYIYSKCSTSFKQCHDKSFYKFLSVHTSTSLKKDSINTISKIGGRQGLFYFLKEISWKYIII